MVAICTAVNSASAALAASSNLAPRIDSSGKTEAFACPLQIVAHSANGVEIRGRQRFAQARELVFLAPQEAHDQLLEVLLEPYHARLQAVVHAFIATHAYGRAHRAAPGCASTLCTCARRMSLRMGLASSASQPLDSARSASGPSP